MLLDAVDNRVFPGCVFGYVDAGREPTVIAVGGHTYEQTALMTVDSVFDVASVTKVVPTSSIALQLVETGALGLDDRVRSFIPELSGRHSEAVTIRHLLTHTAAFNLRMSALKELEPEAVLHAVFSANLNCAPGASFSYSNAASLLLGIIIERTTGRSLDVLAAERFFVPLGMNRTTFDPGRFDREQIVPTEIDPWRGREIRGEIHDESAWKLRSVMVPGSAGLFTTAGDLLKFCGMMICGGTVNGMRFFSSETLRQITTNQIPQTGECTGLGWEYNQPRYMGRSALQLIGKTGFTGCVIMCGLMRGQAMVLLSNYTWPRRKPDKTAIDRTRACIADLVFSR